MQVTVVFKVESGREMRCIGGVGESLLAIAARHKIAIEHTCGGVCACATCHVIVTEGAAQLTPASEGEWDQLEQAPGVTPNSRLSCQARVIAADGVVRCVVPDWNRNAVKEGEH